MSVGLSILSTHISSADYKAPVKLLRNACDVEESERILYPPDSVT